MLRDEERKVIDELERQFSDTPPAPAPRPVPGALQLVGALLLSTLMMLGGMTAGALAFGGAAAAIGLAWWYAHEPDDTPGHPRDGHRA